MAGKLLITPNQGSVTAGQDPTIKFQGTGNSTDITLRVATDGSLSFEGNVGQLFSITNSLTGSIFAVNDISGIPSIEVIDTGLVKINEFNGNLQIGASTNLTNQVTVKGTTDSTSTTTGALVVSGGLGVAKSIWSGTTIASTGLVSLGSASFVNTYDATASGRNVLVGSSASTTLSDGAGGTTIVNSNTTTSNFSSLNFATVTGANANYFSSAMIQVLHGARTNGQYPTGQFIISNSKVANAAPTESFRIAVDGTTTLGGTSTAPALTVSYAVTAGTQNQWIQTYADLNNGPRVVAQDSGGGTTNPNLYLSSGGTGSIYLYTGSMSVAQVRINHTASANRYITLTGSSGGDPTISTTAGNLAIGAIPTYTTSTAVTAAGTAQGNATVLTSTLNNVTTVAAGTGVLLPTTAAGLRIVVRNGGANALNVYPTGSTTINAGGAGAAYSLATNGVVEFIAMTSTAWYTLNTYA